MSSPMPDEVSQVMARYGITEEEAKVSIERRKVYGDPKVNHDGIAAAWAGLLQPWAARIAAGVPIPPHVVALMMVALKTNRMRMTYHDDNFVDLHVYLSFARRWQRDFERERLLAEASPYDYPVVMPDRPTTDHVVGLRWTLPDTENP